MAIHYVEEGSPSPNPDKSPTPEPAIPEDVYEHTASETSDPKSSSSDPSTPEQTAAEPARPKYSPRADRINQKPTSRNAQGLFLPSCCVFVGNLSIKMSIQELEDDLTALLSTFGRCHVKIKIANDKKLPVGFVQFEDRESAMSTLDKNGQLILHNRALRLELSNCKRTAFFGHNTDTPISRDEIISALESHGALENITIKRFVHYEGFKSSFGIITFAYPDDYADALQFFQNHRKYYMIRANMDSKDSQPPQDYPAPGHRPSNQPPPTRGHQQRYGGNRSRPYHRPWYSGSNNNRGGYRGTPGGAPRQSPSFSNNGQNPPFNGQGHSPHGSFSQNYLGGNNFPQGYAGNNYNPGYPNPIFNQSYPGNNFAQNYQGNNFPPSYPNPNFVAPGVFPGPPMMFNQMPMAEGPPPPYPSEYTAMPNPGFPIYQSFQPPNPLPPIVTQSQAVPGSDPPHRRVSSRPDCSMIISSQPQFDTEEHMRLYYETYPPNEVYPGMQQAWVGYPAGDYMQQGYIPPYSPGAGYDRSRQPSMESQKNPNSPPRANASESTLTQTKIDSEENNRGRQLTRDHHANTDGGSDMAPVADPTQTKDNTVDSKQSSNSTDVAELPVSQNEPASVVDAPQVHEPHHECTEPENEHEPQPETQPELQPEPSVAAPQDKKTEELSDEAKQSLDDDAKRSESTGSSGAGRKTPDTDKSQERINSQASAPGEVAKSAKTQTTETTESLKPVENETPTKGTSKAPTTPDTAATTRPAKRSTPDKEEGGFSTTPTPTKDGGKRLEPAVPDDKHLLARHAFQHRKPLKKKYQPKTSSGKTVEQYTREINAQRSANDPDSRVPEHLLQEVIQELEDERRENARKSRGLGPSDKSSTGSGASKK